MVHVFIASVELIDLFITKESCLYTCTGASVNHVEHVLRLFMNTMPDALSILTNSQLQMFYKYQISNYNLCLKRAYHCLEDRRVGWKIGYKISRWDNLCQVNNNCWGWSMVVWHDMIGGNFPSSLIYLARLPARLSGSWTEYQPKQSQKIWYSWNCRLWTPKIRKSYEFVTPKV